MVKRMATMGFVAAIPAAVLIGDLSAGAQAPGQQAPGGRGAARGGFVLGADSMPGTAAEHLSKLKLPAGFSIALYADNVPGARSMALGSDGTVFVGTRAQTVYAVVDRNKDFKADEVLTLASGLTSPNGVAFRDGALYVAENSRISRYDGVLDFAKVAGGKGPTPKQTVLTDKLPPDRMHGWKYLTFGPDGLLYSAIGAPGNILDRGDPYATIIRMKPEPGTQWEIFARGVRNTVGYTWHPDTREMWFTDNGRDALSDDTPNDELNVRREAGPALRVSVLPPGRPHRPRVRQGKELRRLRRAGAEARTARRGSRSQVLRRIDVPAGLPEAAPRREPRLVEPLAAGQPHRLPADARESAEQQGHELRAVRGRLAAGGARLRDQTPGVGTAGDLLELPDGSLLVSDDRANVIYRITYRR